MDKFSEQLLLGVTTSAFQIEGASHSYGKGENIWDRLLEERPELVRDGSRIGIAADAYHLYEEDISLIKEIKFDAYKFSISWARILPDGTLSNINQMGIDHYTKMIDTIVEQGIIPMVTMYHFDLPMKLQELGGWCNPLLVEYFADYANLLFQLFGDKVKWWTTFNEPLEIVHGYSDCRYAPYLSLECFDADYIVGHNILKAHAKVYHLYRKKFYAQQNGKISIILSGMNFIPKSPKNNDDEEAAAVARQFTMGWFAHPIYSETGDYPAVMRKLIDENSEKEGKLKSKLPKFSPQEIEEIRGSSDFFAFNHYTSMLTSSLNGEGKRTIFRLRDTKVALEIDKNWPNTGAFWCKVVPHGLKEILLWIQKEYRNPAIYIYENGYCDNSGLLEDVDRINFFKGYLKNLCEAINEHKCNVIGYNIWTLVDAFEWLNGYSHKYGIVHVNYEDHKRTRTLKLSALFWKELCQTRCIPEKNYSAE